MLITQVGRCYVTRWLEDWIVEINAQQGAPISRFRWVHEPEAIQEMVSERFLRKAAPSQREIFTEGLDWLEQRVSILGLSEGPKGQILVQRTGMPADERWPTDVFSAEGRYLGRVMLPVEPRTVLARGRSLYGIGTDDGIPMVRRLDIPPPQRYRVPSTIGVRGLDDRVRNGNRSGPSAIATGRLMTDRLASQRPDDPLG